MVINVNKNLRVILFYILFELFIRTARYSCFSYYVV